MNPSSLQRNVPSCLLMLTCYTGMVSTLRSQSKLIREDTAGVGVHNKPVTHQWFPANSWFPALQTNQFANVPSNHITLGCWMPVFTSLYPKSNVGVSCTGSCWRQCPLLQVTSPVLMSFASFLSSRLSSPRSWGGGAYSSATARRHADAWLHLHFPLWTHVGSSVMLPEKRDTLYLGPGNVRLTHAFFIAQNNCKENQTSPSHVKQIPVVEAFIKAVIITHWKEYRQQ